MVSRSLALLFLSVVLMTATLANAGAIVGLVADPPGPYVGGQMVTLDVWLYNQDANHYQLPLVQFDAQASDPALTFAPIFTFDYSSIAGSDYYTELPDVPLPATAYYGQSPVPGRILVLSGYGSLHVGHWDVVLPSSAGIYVADVINASEPDSDAGGRLTLGFCPSWTWRAFTGEITGGMLDVVVTGPCSTHGDCDDGNPCTVDVCGPTGVCEYSNEPNGTECDDANPCIIGETCQAGACTGGHAPACTGYGDQCNTASCDAGGLEGNCDTLTPVPDGTSCSDGVFCNGAETCVAGICELGTPPDCDDGVGCTDDSCNEETESCDNVPNDAYCPDDGLFCNGTEFCEPVNDCASSGDPCAPYACDEGDDQCTSCPQATIRDSRPRNGTVDARQPCTPANALPRQGIGAPGELWSVREPITIRLEPPVPGAEACFELCETKADPLLGPNSIRNVTDLGGGRYEIVLHHAITAGAVTTIEYTGDGSFVTYISHPANVNADGWADAQDILTLVDALNHWVVTPWGIYSEDVDRSNLLGPPDILRVIDLLKGEAVYDPWLNTTLPQCDSCCP